MSKKYINSFTHAMALALCIPMNAYAADVSLFAGVSARDTAGGDIMVMRVAGPDGFYEETLGQGLVDWFPPSDAPDGQYRYEIYVIGDNDERAAVPNDVWERTHGIFWLDGGAVLPPEEESGQDNPQSGSDEGNLFRSIASAVLGWLVPPAAAANLVASDSSPAVQFFDTDPNVWVWDILANEDSFSVQNLDRPIDAEQLPLIIDDDTSMQLGMNANGFEIAGPNSAGGGILDINENAPRNSLRVFANGDVGLADSDIYVDAFAGDLGIGTIIPQADLHISDTIASIRMDRGSTEYYQIHNTDLDFNIDYFDGTTATTFFNFENVNGNLWFGDANPTVIPAAAFYFMRKDGSAKIFVDERSGTSAPRELFRIQNLGNTKLSVVELTSGHNWALANPGIGTGEFRLSQQSSSVVEMQIFKGGNVTIAGTLTENSDRESKTGIEALDGREALAKVARLPVSRWRRKSDPDVAHIGPMAQDFHALFGVGEDPTRIATIDTSGVALAAIKGLNEKNLDLERAVAEKDAEIAKLEERLARLEQLVLGPSVSQRGLVNGELAHMAASQ